MDRLDSGKSERENRPVLASSSLHRLAKLNALLAFAGSAVGALVTSTGSGLANTGGPGFSGGLVRFFSEMFQDDSVLLQRGHRLISYCVLLLTVFFLVVLWRQDERRWARWLGVGAIILALSAAVSGGATVHSELLPLLSIAHAGLALLFLGAVTALAVVTGPGWHLEDCRLDRDPARVLTALATLCLLAVFVEILLGAVPRHATAVVGGKVMVQVGNIVHIIWGFLVFIVVFLAAARVVGRHGKVARLFRPATLLVFLLVVQFFLGLLAFVTLPEEPRVPGKVSFGSHELLTTLHQVAGVIMLLLAWVLALRSWRIRHLGRVEPAAPAGRQAVS